MHIALIGLPGSGKTTIGRHLARQWEVDFVDSDQVIEERLGCSIKDFFAAEGEEAFRAVESQVLAELLAMPGRSLLSTGGGIVLKPENRQLLKAHSTVFYLQSNPDEIAKRLRQDATRPLMQGAAPAKRLRELFQQRSPLYLETAHYVIDSQRQNTAQVSRRICMQAELAGLLPAGSCQSTIG